MAVGDLDGGDRVSPVVRPIKSRKSPQLWFEYSMPGVDGQDAGEGGPDREDYRRRQDP